MTDIGYVLGIIIAGAVIAFIFLARKPRNGLSHQTGAIRLDRMAAGT
jgi:hypothetical protein